MKNLIIVFIALIATCGSINAQEANKFRFDIGFGYVNTSNAGSGLQIMLEPKWTITNRMNAGIRIAGAASYTKGEISNGFVSGSRDQVTAIGSFLGTYDYYFSHNEGSPFAAFVGGGLGYYSSTSVLNVAQNDVIVLNDFDSDGSLGAMVRAGFDVYKFRLAAEVNLFSSGGIRDTNNEIIGEGPGSYYGISLGFYLGGGKWKRN